MNKNKLNYRLINLLLVMVIAYIVIATNQYWGSFFLKIFNVLLPFFIAFVFAYVLNPFVKFLERKGVRKNLAVGIIILVVLTAVIGILWITLPMVYDQLLLFAKSIVEFFQDISSKFDVNLGDIQFKVTDILNGLIEQIGTYVSTGTIDILGKSVNVIANIFIILVVGIYFLLDMDKIRESIKRTLKSFSKKAFQFVKRLDTEVGNYFHGFFILMLVTLIEYSVLYRLVGHPNWMIMGVLMAVLSIIPYFGGIIGNCIGIITASVVSTPVLVGTVLICLIFANVDGYIISPRIYGKTNDLNPIAIIFSMTICGALLGIIGIIAAIPLYITVRCAYQFYKKDIKEKLEDMKENKVA